MKMTYAINELEKALERVKNKRPKSKISLWGEEGCVYRKRVGEVKEELIRAMEILGNEVIKKEKT